MSGSPARMRLALLAVIVLLLASTRFVVARHLFTGAAPALQGDLTSVTTHLAFQLWVPCLMLAAGAFLGFARPDDDHAWRASLMFLCFAAMTVQRGVPGLAPGWDLLADIIGSAGSLFLPCFALAFFLRYPHRAPIDVRWPWLRRTAFALTGLLWAWFTLLTLDAQIEALAPLASLLPRVPRRPWFQWAVFSWISLLYGWAASTIWTTTMTARGEERRRMNLILVGSQVAFTSLGLIVLISNLGLRAAMLIAVLAVGIGLFPLGFVYAVLRHRVFGIRLILRRGLQYALVSQGFVAVQFLIVFAVLFSLMRHLQDTDTRSAAVIPAVAAAGLMAGLVPFNRRMFPVIDRRFFREAYNAQQVLLELGRAARRQAAHPGELLPTITARISEALHPDGVAVFLRDESWPQLEHLAEPAAGFALYAAQAANGVASRALDPQLPADPRMARVITGPVEGDVRPIEVEDGLLVPIVTGGRVLGVLSLGPKLSEEPYSREDKDLLLTVAEQMAVALENAQLFGQVAAQDRLRREVEIAREVQGHLFPKSTPPLPTLRYCGACRPARGVGGDYYDFLPLDRQRLALALGDIAGKGISAALLMATLQALLRSYAPMRGDDLCGLMDDLNRRMLETSESGRYATFFYALYDDSTRGLTYVNAGHNPPLVVRASGAVHRLTEGGPVIGLLPGSVAYAQGRTELGPGDVLVVYSDGISEAESPTDEMFGEERLAALVASGREMDESALRDLILDEVARFAEGRPQGDDQTVVVARGV